MNRIYLGLGLVVAMAGSFTVVAQTPPGAANPSTGAGPPLLPAASHATTEETGLAAVYSDRLSGHATASGEAYDPNKLTAAHKSLPFGTRIRVTNTRNGKSVELRITDRGPRQASRILDITPRAARALDVRKSGVVEVKLKVIEGKSQAH